MPDQALEHGTIARRGSRSRSPIARARAAPSRSCSKNRTRTADTPPRLRLGDVVQERRQLQHVAARRSRPPSGSAEVRGQLLAERRQRRSARRDAVGAGHGPERVLEHGKRWGSGCGRPAHGLDLGEHDGEEPSAVGTAERAGGGAAAASSASSSSRTRSAATVASARRARRDMAARVAGVSRKPSVSSSRTPRSARSGSSAARRPREAQAPGARSASPPSGSTTGARPRASSAAQRHRQRVDREVASGQVAGERGRAEVGEVDACPGGRPRAPRPVLVEGDEGPAQAHRPRGAPRRARPRATRRRGPPPAGVRGERRARRPPPGPAPRRVARRAGAPAATPPEAVSDARARTTPHPNPKPYRPIKTAQMRGGDEQRLRRGPVTPQGGARSRRRRWAVFIGLGSRGPGRRSGTRRSRRSSRSRGA